MQNSGIGMFNLETDIINRYTSAMLLMNQEQDLSQTIEVVWMLVEKATFQVFFYIVEAEYT